MSQLHAMWHFDECFHSVSLSGPLKGVSDIRCCQESVTRIKWATTWMADTRLTFIVYLQNGLIQQNIISQVNSAFPDALNRTTHRRGMDLFSSKVCGGWQLNKCRVFSKKKQVKTGESVHLKPVNLLIGEFKGTGWMSKWTHRDYSSGTFWLRVHWNQFWRLI